MFVIILNILSSVYSKFVQNKFTVCQSNTSRNVSTTERKHLKNYKDSNSFSKAKSSVILRRRP